MAAAAPTMGYRLLPWQVANIADWSAVRPDGRWVHPRCGDSIPRQAGKSVVAIVWAAVLAALMGYKVLWTDHNYSTTMEMLERFRDIFGSRPGDTRRGLPAWRRRLADCSNQTGQEWMAFRSGGVIQFSTRTKASKLGFSFDVVVYDEAQELRDEHVQAINPTTTSGEKHNLQLIYTGTPTRAGSPAEVFRRVRRQALAGGPEAADLCWTEYGAEEIGDPRDESRWPLVNPSFGAHADPVAIRTGMKDMDDLAAAQEYLGYWLPEGGPGGEPMLAPGEWEACLVPEGPAPSGSERIAYGVKFAPDGSDVSLAVASADEGRCPHVELIACRPAPGSTSWLAGWLMERAGEGCAVAVDGKSGAGALAVELSERKAPKGYVMRPTADAAVSAAATMLESIRGKRITNIEQPALDLSARTSTRRAIGGAGGFGCGGESSTPIEACGLALLALRTSKRNPKRRMRVG